MDLFFDPEFSDSDPVLEKSESHHCIRVLRNKPGDQIQVTDGKGSIWSGKIIGFENQRVSLDLLSHHEEPHPELKRSLAVSIPKSSDRLEWIVEKGTELGMHSFYPIHSEFSERKNINAERLLKKAVSACKQSHNPFLPKIHPLTSYDELLANTHSFKHKFICHQGAGSIYTKEINGQLLFLIGPEGGFSESELIKANKHSFSLISLGRYILRTETAAITALSLPFPNNR